MTACKIARLPDRTVIGIGGEDAHAFLQGLITGDMERVTGGDAIHAALLTPQGKILFDFFVVAQGEDFLLECRREIAGDLIKRLTFYRLRAAVEITDRADAMSVYAIWDGDPAATAEGHLFADPRLPALGHRLIAPAGGDISASGCEPDSDTAYHAHRISLGVPEGGLDFAFGDTFPHEADYDQLHGVDFAKGCFIGQEVVSRMEHRGTARKRIVPVEGHGDLAAGAEVTAGDAAIGTTGSAAGNRALALIRLDRAEKAIGEGQALEAGGVAIVLVQPGWASFTVPGARGDAP